MWLVYWAFGYLLQQKICGIRFFISGFITLKQVNNEALLQAWWGAEVLRMTSGNPCDF
jgi:hypothetical protein